MKKELASLIDVSYRLAGNATVILADRLKDIGYQNATRAGISISIRIMMIPPSRAAAQKAHDDVREIEERIRTASSRMVNGTTKSWTSGGGDTASPRDVARSGY
jgi:DNA-directed RNA polymerase subunit beta'